MNIKVGQLLNRIPYRLIPVIGRKYCSYRRLIKSYDSSSDREEWIFSRVLKVVTFAYDNIPFFKEFYDSKSFHPSCLQSLSDIKKIPVMGKDDLVDMLHEAVEGIKMRGKSTTGEQTMLDAMVPALEALKATGDLKAALAAAEEGVEKTKGMIATKGRASYLGERSLGHQDPGATSFTLLFSVIAKNA